MKLMKQKRIQIFFLLCEHMGPTSFLYIYILLRLAKYQRIHVYIYTHTDI
jgi:hypothetical protein